MVQRRVCTLNLNKYTHVCKYAYHELNVSIFMSVSVTIFVVVEQGSTREIEE